MSKIQLRGKNIFNFECNKMFESGKKCYNKCFFLLKIEKPSVGSGENGTGSAISCRKGLQRNYSSQRLFRRGG